MKPFWNLLVVIFIASELSFAITLGNVESSTINILERMESDNSLCTTDKCIMKCCPFGKYLTLKRTRQKNERICNQFGNSTRDFASLAEDIFHEYPDLSKLNFTVKAGIFEANNTFKTVSVNAVHWFNLYLTEYPELYLELPNAYERWTRIPNDAFCWDHRTVRSNNSLIPGFWVVFPADPIEYVPISSTYSLINTAAMLVSCFFLLIVLVVYAVLPELRNLCGQILMAYVASLFAAFLLLAVMRIQQHEEIVCRAFTFLIYYFFLASFCWMNVIAYDIWWTSRAYGKARSMTGCAGRYMFRFFCLYAFGLPLVMTVAMAILNEIDMSHVPWFVTPKVPYNGCFIEGGEKFLYLYVPMLILMSCNWIFYLMTAFNMWRLSRGTTYHAAVEAPNANRKHRNRLIAFLKLSVVIGLTWVLEVVSYRYPGYTIWYISDYFNILTGVYIFLIFVCRRKILKKLVKKCRPGPYSSESISSTSGAEVQEWQTLQVGTNS